MSVKILNPFRRIVGVSWPNEEKQPKDGLFLLKLYFGQGIPARYAGMTGYLVGLSNYITPIEGQVTWIRHPSEYAVRVVDSFERSGGYSPPWLRDDANAFSSGAGFDHMQGIYLQAKHSEFIGLGGFSQRVAGNKAKIAISLWPSATGDLWDGVESWEIPYRLEWESYWGDNIDYTQVVKNTNTSFFSHYEYGGPYEVKQSGGANFLEMFQAHAHHVFADNQWLWKHVWEYDETTGTLSGPEYEL